jgi:hypothetical protein
MDEVMAECGMRNKKSNELIHGGNTTIKSIIPFWIFWHASGILPDTVKIVRTRIVAENPDINCKKN